MGCGASTQVPAAHPGSAERLSSELESCKQALAQCKLERDQLAAQVDRENGGAAAPLQPGAPATPGAPAAPLPPKTEAATAQNLCRAIADGDTQRALALLKDISKDEVLQSAEPAGSLRWDGSVASYGSGVISGDERTVTRRGNQINVRTRQGFRAGRHSWRVKGAGEAGVIQIRLGIVPRGFSLNYTIGKSGSHQGSSYGFFSSGVSRANGSWQSGQKPPTFASGDVVQLTLDSDQGTLAAQNVTQGSPAVVVCTSLPRGEEFFPAASVYNDDGNSVELLEDSALYFAVLHNTTGGVISRLLALGGRELLEQKYEGGQTARELATAKGHTDAVAEIDRWVAQQAAWEQAEARTSSFLAAARDNDLATLKTLVARDVNILYVQDAAGAAPFTAPWRAATRTWWRTCWSRAACAWRR